MRDGEIWMYVGAGEGRGAHHRVIWLDAVDIITWSLPCTMVSGGWSWRGSRDDFYNDFKRLTK